MVHYKNKCLNIFFSDIQDKKFEVYALFVAD